jgi:excisionase family DNA binding protein
VTQETHTVDFGRVGGMVTEWLNAAEAAAYLKVQKRTVLLWVRQKKIRAYALSGIKRRVWRFRKADLDACLLAQPWAVLSCEAPSVLVQKGEEK